MNLITLSILIAWGAIRVGAESLPATIDHLKTTTAFSRDVFLDFALKLSQEAPETMERTRSTMTGFYSLLKRGTDVQTTLQFLHARVLSGTYQKNQTYTDIAITTGNYNCVSATIIYICLLKHLQYGYKILDYGTHVAVGVKTATGYISVEPTNQEGFGLHMGKKAIEISDRDLLLMILENRIVLEEARKNFARAFVLAVYIHSCNDKEANKSLVLGRFKNIIIWIESSLGYTLRGAQTVLSSYEQLPETIEAKPTLLQYLEKTRDRMLRDQRRADLQSLYTLTLAHNLTLQ